MSRVYRRRLGKHSRHLSLEGVSLAPARMFSTSPSTGAVLGALTEGVFHPLVSEQTLSPSAMGEVKFP